MKNKIILYSVLIGTVLIMVIVMLYFSLNNSKEQFEFTQIEKGDIREVVSCTGNIDAQKTVEVGTQVSGTISRVFVDNNSLVKKNQLLAILDTKLLEIAVKQAEADLLKASTQYELNLKEYENNIELNKNKLISDFELEKLKVTKDSSYAQKISAETNLLKAKTNLDYALIRSPINGIIIEKNIEEGQTVASSFSAPVLFTIAEDLSNIQIKALVAEQDIGRIKSGQKVTFTVEAYPEEIFEGIVDDIYLKPTIQQNVVNYTTIINAKNKNSMLKPGMTATIDIILDERKDVFLIANIAFRFKPTEIMLEKFKDTNPDKISNNKEKNKRNGELRSQLKTNNKKSSRLWYIDNDNKLKFIILKTGLNNGQKTEIISDKITEGMKIITGTTTVKKNTTTNNSLRLRRMF
ncbi:MAG: efflux RND transporter periplasmic adaptor subunit [Spirochaetes bacterium]|nr:efflux RND transporter periplasmic adaptor subunit [Spirochaetota bacterium]